jgi:hypothetical protein
MQHVLHFDTKYTKINRLFVFPVIDCLSTASPDTIASRSLLRRFDDEIRQP